MTEEKSIDANFREYHSMENIQKSGWVKTIEQHPCAEQKWIMLEKIHGANFQFWTDGVEVKVGKRTSYLIPYEVKYTDKESGKEVVKPCDPLDGTIEKKVLNELVVLYLDDIIKDVQKDLDQVLAGGDYKELRKNITLPS
jgi:hypothetical protein